MFTSFKHLKCIKPESDAGNDVGHMSTIHFTWSVPLHSKYKLFDIKQSFEVKLSKMWMNFKKKLGYVITTRLNLPCSITYYKTATASSAQACSLQATSTETESSHF